MNNKFQIVITLIVSVGICLPAVSAQVPGNSGFVNAVLFYSRDCPHCHQVIEEILIPLNFEYPESLQIFGVDTATPAGSRVFQNYIDTFEVSSSRQGVPALVVGNTALAGEEIVNQAVPLIEGALSAGGTPLPDIPGLIQGETSYGENADLKPLETVRDEFMQASPAQVSPETELDAADKILSWPVFVFLVLSLFFFFVRLSKYGLNPFSGTYKPRIPVFLFLLTLAGMSIALYLSYVEIQHVDALCGPIGDCNAVQKSSFSRIFGFPVAVLGAVYYLIFFLFMCIYRAVEGISARALSLGLILMAFMAVLYSLFLTGLEMWVIHAVCAWCLGSAVISGVMLIVISKKFARRPVFSQ